MITVSRFVNANTSFWNNCFPALENYVRIVNSGAYERYFNELDWKISSSRSALVSEVAFCMCKGDGEQQAYASARDRLSGLRGVVNDEIPLSEDEFEVCRQLAYRMGYMIGQIKPKSKLIFDPLFLGCGLLAQSFGDVLAGNTLIEIKSVDRGFRSSDFKQLMTYLLQETVTGKSEIQELCVLNARKGIAHHASIEQFLFDTSASNILDVHIKFMASVGFGGTSR